MLVCSRSATEICITMLDEDSYTDDAEHPFANFSDDGKTRVHYQDSNNEFRDKFVPLILQIT